MTPTKKNPLGSRLRSGLSLLEIVIILVFMGILLVAAISRLEIRGDTGGPYRSIQTKAAISELRSAILIYEAENTVFPKTLDVLIEQRAIRKIKTDGWGQPFQYDPETGEIWSGGGPTGATISSLDLK